MPRIRTIKPELIKHELLFDAEEETGLPMRIAWVMLFTVCDREGRFQWRPRTLKADVLPFDNVDFSRVLDAWLTRGFVVKYRVGDAWFGMIPSFKRHQIINNREKESEIPGLEDADEVYSVEPSNDGGSDACPTRAPRDDEGEKIPLSGKERKGKERKGREGNTNRDSGESRPGGLPQKKYPEDFENHWRLVTDLYKRAGDQAGSKIDAFSEYKKIGTTGGTASELENYLTAQVDRKILIDSGGGRRAPLKHYFRWLRKNSWEDGLENLPETFSGPSRSSVTQANLSSVQAFLGGSSD